MHLVSQSPQDTKNIAAQLAKRVLSSITSKTTATIIALRGELGSGKTTFTQGFASALGVVKQPKSPTFNLAKQYSIPNTTYSLWHLDCYRLTGFRDLKTINLHQLFTDSSNIILIEWPENIGDGLPSDHIEIHFTHTGNDTRGITLPA
jgi:tRNA threonylcarbamoyladenosine biosynthesis protein TsaE